MDALIGKSLGRYHILEHLGEGGMARVYRALDTRLEREVAVKVLAPIFQTTPKSLKRFELEARTLAQLKHPNIVEILDFGTHDGITYLVMEFIHGGTLKQLIASQPYGKDIPFPWYDAATLLAPIADALRYAHEKHIIHRDIKPSNILIDRQHKPVLTDFGIAKILDLGETLDLTVTGVGMGTPEYMAPEHGLGKKVDERSDIYSLGVVFYELVVGRKPYTADTPLAVLHKHAYDPLPRPRDINRDIPDKVERVLLHALEKEQANRYENMGLFARTLQNLSAEGQAQRAASLQKLQEKEALERRRAKQEQEKLLRQRVELELKEKQRREREKVSRQKAQERKRKLEELQTKFQARVRAAGQAVRNPEHYKWLRSWYKSIQSFGQSIRRPENRKKVMLFAGVAAVCISILGMALTNTYPWDVLKPVLADLKVSEVSEQVMETSISPTATLLLPTSTQVLTIATRVSEKDGMTMVYVPAGEFEMGSEDGNPDEQPVHTVYLDPYWIDQTEVTNTQYKLCVQAETCEAPSGEYYNDSDYADHPVVGVDWYDANNYCTWAGRRLSTEAQWEKAARGTDARTYPWGVGIDCNKASYFDCKDITTPVGSHPEGASPYGALDMAGNVWEWVADWYDESYYRNSSTSNPTGPASGDYRILRGGAWDTYGRNLRASYRFWYEEDLRFNSFGFRCATPKTQIALTPSPTANSTSIVTIEPVFECVPGGIYVDQAGDVETDMTDILKVETTLENSNNLIINMYLRNIPEEILLPKGLGVWQYYWNVYINTDRNRNTGRKWQDGAGSQIKKFSGIDYTMAIYCATSSIERKGPIEDLCEGTIFKSNPVEADYDIIMDSINFSIDYDKDILIFSGSLNDLSTDSFLYFAAEYEGYERYGPDVLCR